jgi:hypothetical protein
VSARQYISLTDSLAQNETCSSPKARATCLASVVAFGCILIPRKAPGTPSSGCRCGSGPDRLIRAPCPSAIPRPIRLATIRALGTDPTRPGDWWAVGPKQGGRHPQAIGPATASGEFQRGTGGGRKEKINRLSAGRGFGEGQPSAVSMVKRTRRRSVKDPRATPVSGAATSLAIVSSTRPRLPLGDGGSPYRPRSSRRSGSSRSASSACPSGVGWMPSTVSPGTMPS